MAARNFLGDRHVSLGVGIVGCGMIAKFHAKAIADAVGADFIGATSRRQESTDAFLAVVPGKSYSSVQSMCQDPDIDLVSICTPSGAHLEPAIIAAQAGKHVIIEKPLEITLERCDKIIRACQDNNVVLSTIFPSRFHKASQHLKKAISGGRFGTLTLGDAYVKWFRTQAYYDSGAWRGTWDLDGGGALMNQAIHSVDLLLWLMGPVRQLSAQTATLAHDRIEVEDVATASLQFANGALGVIQATTAAFPGMLKRIEVHGSQGSAVIEEEDIKMWTFDKSDDLDASILEELTGKTETGGGASDPSAIGHHGHTAQFNDVISAIQNGTQPLIDGLEGRHSVEVILAIYEAAKKQQTVVLPIR